MIIRRHGDRARASDTISGPGWTSDRILVRNDGLPYSMHITTVTAGRYLELHYLNHIEAVYCISGRGQITEAEKGTQHEISAGTLYVLNNHDRHTLYAHTDIQGVCIFTPPTVGNEIHDDSGGYPISF